ncbi:uncharacterized protein DUF4446 [Keratinibaculum paraultunense]|uniref:Uncharacterized protein DUF4446 n=1 Tax=Keratinibaculum paraultunense TaxID=1278232 RepID=A0A4R3KQB8_9FIRM|nr:DUF4446 family protein [Keratinibaculum paraultunense]QQY79745.1 DUF4446 family protein [Keratinibaculum paraultunense]TCS86946.1 uncharacterized protein DUF4446 [Keratinibaculum paraultunense]
MEQIREIVEIHNVEIVLGLLVAFLLLLALYLIVEIKFSKLKTRYDKLVQGKDGIDIEELLIKNGYEIDKMKDDIVEIYEKLDKLEKKLNFAVQKIGFIRYNAFGDMGSELSFSIAFLDDFLNGFVLTSIYGREHSTCYAKPIKNGKSEYPLSVEEMQAIDRAVKKEYYTESI